jgi:epidermal growth factor receptor substrate 15
MYRQTFKGINMKHLLTFLFVFLVTGAAFSQVECSMEYSIIDYNSGKKLTGVNVDVFDGANIVKSGESPSNGTVKLSVPSGKKYKVVFSKAGKVSRMLYIDSKGINAEDIQGGSSVGTGKIEVKLFDEIPGVDFSYVENNPFTEFYFEGNATLSYDTAIAEKMAKKITELLKQAAAKESENEAKYQDAMAKAKEWYNKKNYQFALDKYEEASLLKPNEQEPKDKIKELDALLKKQQEDDLVSKQKEGDYQKIIDAANALTQQKKYAEAVVKYEEALKIKDEQYVRDQIKDIKGFIDKAKKEEELEANYKKAIAAGDNLAGQNKFADAKVQYQEALKLKKNDPVATQKIADLEQKIKDEQAGAEKKKKYEATIAAAEQLFAADKLLEAKAKFNEALTIDGTQTLPRTKISAIDTRLANEAKKKEITEKYNAAMKDADDLFNANKFVEAKAKYNEALKIDESQSKPLENISKIDKMLADIELAKKEKEKQDKINALIKDAAGIYAKNDLENAKKKYEEVLTLDASNMEATTKINEINGKISANQSEKEKLDRFNSLKAKGIDLMKQQKWTDAKSTLLEAKSIKSDAEIDTKIKEIDAKIAEENAKLNAEEQYKKILDEAKALENTNIDAAILKYKEAQKNKANDPIPPAKIKELEAKKANNNVQAETDKKYNDLMKKGDDAMALGQQDVKKYSDAIKFYNDALLVKPSEKEPVEKAALAKKLSEDAAKGEAFAQYQKILTAGQKAIDEKNWTKARDMYNRAIKLDPEDAKPKDKLKEIDALIKVEEDAKKGNLDKENTYKTKLADAEIAAKAKEYDKAISLLNEAKNLKPTEVFPPKRIQEIEDLKSKEQNSAQTEKLYSDYMKKGSDAVNTKNYSLALSEYKNALTVKNNDKTALAKIDEVQQLIDNETNSKTDEEFKQFVKEGDDLFKAEKWLDSKNAYEKALKIKNDFYAKSQYDKATKNAQINNDFEKQYQKVITSADNNFDTKNYDKAKELYERAITLKSTDQYPKDKLKEIDALLNPVVVQKAGPLNNLGTPTGDLEKVNEELVKAELKRKDKKNTKLNNKKNTLQDKDTETSENKTSEILLSRNNLELKEKSISEKYEDGDEKRQVTVDQVEDIRKVKSKEDIQTENFKYNENLQNTEYSKNVTVETSNQYESSVKVYEENTENVKDVDQKIVSKTNVENISAYSKNIDDQKELYSKNKKVDENYGDDFDSRKVIEDDVKKANISINKNDDVSQVKESQNITNIDVNLQKEEKVRVKEVDEANKVYGENSESLKVIDKKIVKSEIETESKFIDKSLEADIILANKAQKIDKIAPEQEINRKENAEILKTGEVKINENTRVEYNNNLVKHLTNQDELISKAKKTDVINENEVKKSQDIITGIDGIDKKVTISHSQQDLSDDIQRKNTNDDVTKSAISVNNNHTEKAKKVDENISSVQLVGNDFSATKNKEELKKQDALTNSQVLLSKISSKEVKFDDKIANEVGTLYPEGVSQEVFENKDEDGFLVNVVTRRIVVKSGHGQIYVRTQSLNGITYSKNGEPSSEHIWQKETQDAKLIKNY